MIAYLDASALVKLLVEEEGSDLAGELWDAADLLVSSELAYPEVRAALASAARDRRLSAAGHRRSVRSFDDLWEEINALELTDLLAHVAGETADRFGLRGADAVHLASAIQALDAGTVLVTWDRELASAALAAGLGIAPA